MQTSSVLIKNAFIKLKPREEWSFRDAGRSQTTAFTHDYHRYPAKFIPQIVKKLIEDYAPSGTQVVCDPFGGCGTTLVEAKLLGHRSIGFDINPVAKLITQTKTTPIKPRTLTNYRDKFCNIMVTLQKHPTNTMRELAIGLTNQQSLNWIRFILLSKKSRIIMSAAFFFARFHTI